MDGGPDACTAALVLAPVGSCGQQASYLLQSEGQSVGHRFSHISAAPFVLCPFTACCVTLLGHQMATVYPKPHPTFFAGTNPVPGLKMSKGIVKRDRSG